MPAGPGENALLVGMPLRHLVDARQVCRAHGQVTLPAGGAGDTGRRTPGLHGVSDGVGCRRGRGAGRHVGGGR